MRISRNHTGWATHTKRAIARLGIGLSLSLLAACSSLPHINPDLATRPSGPVRLEGARGPLTHKQSQAILAKLQRGSENSNIFERHLALQQSILGSPLTVGNKVQLLVDGEDTYDAMFAAIEAAEDNINMETFILEDDEVGRRFADALIAKQLNGVQVNLIYDSVGCLNTPQAFFQRMIDTGINVLEYNPVNPLTAGMGWDVNQRDHRKLLVVDGKIAFVGGINISSVYSSGSLSSSGSVSKSADPESIDGLPWRDTHLRIEGPVVADFQKLFITTWQTQRENWLALRDYFPTPKTVGNEVVLAIGSTPDDPFSLIYVTLLSVINSAETHVYLTNAYFVPDPQLLAALKNAVQRGVDVKLLLPSQTDSNLVFYASRSFYKELLSAGVQIYEHQDALLHAKTALIDGVWSTIGSTNLDWRSFLYNQEINAVVLGQEFGDKMLAMFNLDLKSSERITLDEWKDRPVLSRVKEFGARLWARWL